MRHLQGPDVEHDDWLSDVVIFIVAFVVAWLIFGGARAVIVGDRQGETQQPTEPSVVSEVPPLEGAKAMELVSITAYASVAGAGGAVPWKCALYKEADSSLVATTEELDIAGPFTGWVTFDFTAAVSLQENTRYVLMVWGEGGEVYYDADGTSYYDGDETAYGAWPDPANLVEQDRVYSIYATTGEGKVVGYDTIGETMYDVSDGFRGSVITWRTVSLESELVLSDEMVAGQSFSDGIAVDTTVVSGVSLMDTFVAEDNPVLGADMESGLVLGDDLDIQKKPCFGHFISDEDAEAMNYDD